MKNKNRYIIFNIKSIFFAIILPIFFTFLPNTAYAGGGYAWGVLEDSDCTNVTGYAVDPTNTSLSIDVTLYEGASAFDGGTFIATITANIYREDVNVAYGITGNHGFSFTVPEYLKDGPEHIIYAHAIDSGGSGPNYELSNSGSFSFNCVPAITTPSMNEVYINSNEITANNSSEYYIKVVGVDIGGVEKISEMYAMINRDGDNSGQYRGWLTWYKDESYTGWDSLKNKMSCNGGGIAAIQNSYGDSYLRLIECSSFQYSDTLRKASFWVSFDPTFTSPISDNDISGYVKNTNSNTSGWVNQDINFRLAGNFPSNPVVTGPTTGVINQNYTFDFSSTDPGGNQIKYGIDWSIPADNTVDEWVPASGYVNSGVTKSAVRSWSSLGEKILNVLSMNSLGLSSNPVAHSIYLSSGLGGPTLVASPSSVSISGNRNVTGTFSNIAVPTNMDWIGIYLAGTADSAYLDWIYTSNCTQTPSSSTPTDGSCVLVMPSVAGTYNFRIFENDGWSKLETSNTITVVNTGPTETLTVTTNTTLGGRVTGTGIDCGYDCSEDVPLGTQVTLTAVPLSSYWKFTGWSGGGCSGSGSCVFNVSSNVTINANYVPRAFIYKEQ